MTGLISSLQKGQQTILKKGTQKAVLSRNIAVHPLTNLFGLASRSCTQGWKVDHGSKKQIRRQIVRRLKTQHRLFLCTEMARAFPGNGDNHFGQQAEIVFGVSVTNAIAQPLPNV